MENQCIILSEVQESCFLIDWLTFTDFIHQTPQEVMSFLGLPEDKISWTYRRKFQNGYPEHYFWHNITISYGADNPKFYDDPSKARSNMGICINMSGQGCRAFESQGGDWLKLFHKFIGDLPSSLYKLMPDAFCRAFKERHRFNVTRLDLAFDDHTGILDIWRIRSDIHDRNYVSKAKAFRDNWSDDLNEDIQGLSLEIGARSSAILIRIYDKAAERGFKDRHWIRVELQLRDDRALVALARFMQLRHIGCVASGILRNYITFRVPTEDTNKSRWPVALYWLSLLGQMERISLWLKPGEPYNIHKTQHYLIKQYGQVISTLSEIQDPMALIESCRKCFPRDKLSSKYVQIIEDHLRENPAPAPDPHVIYFNHGMSIDGIYYPYQQDSLDDLPREWLNGSDG